MPDTPPPPDGHARDHDEALRQLLEGSGGEASRPAAPLPAAPRPAASIPAAALPTGGRVPPRPAVPSHRAAAAPPSADALEFLNRLETAQQRQQRILVEFFTTLRQLTPRVWVTRALIGLNIAVFVVMAASGVGLLMPQADDLIAWGANYGPNVADGQWWRIITCTFIHIGVIHLAFNMWALASGGRILEPLLGNVGFLALYLISGLSGSLASVIWNPFVLSAGASGAVFGVFGGLLGFLLRRHDSIPGEVLRPLRSSGGAFVFCNLILGMQIQGIDMAAHLGGLGAGFVCGLIQSQPLVPAAGRRRWLRNLAVVGLAAAVLWPTSFLLPLDRIRFREAYQHFSLAERAVVETDTRAGKEYAAGTITPRRYAEILESEILPPWRQQQERLADMGLGPALAPLGEMLVEYARLREEGWKELAGALRAGDRRQAAEAQQRHQQADDLAGRVKAALRAAGL